MSRQWVFFIVALAMIGAVVFACFAQDATEGRQQLLDAAKNGDRGAVANLIGTGISVSAKDASGLTPLHLAAGGGHQATAQTLFENGADVNAKDNKGHTPLDAALANGHTGMAEFLRSKGGIRGAVAMPPAPPPVSAEVAAALRQQLLDAGKKGDMDELWKLVKTGAPIDARDGSGWTALHFLAANGE